MPLGNGAEQLIYQKRKLRLKNILIRNGSQFNKHCFLELDAASSSLTTPTIALKWDAL